MPELGTDKKRTERSLFDLPDSTFHANRKLASLSVSRMKKNIEAPDQYNEGLLHVGAVGQVIPEKEIQVKVKTFLSKCKTIETYLNQVPSLMTNFKGLSNSANKSNVKIKRNMDTRRNSYIQNTNQNNQNTINQYNQLIREQEEAIQQLEQELEEAENNEDEDEILRINQELYQEKQYYRDIQDEFIIFMNGIDEDFNESLPAEFDEYDNPLPPTTSVNSFFGKITSSIDDANMYFVANIDPYKNDLNAVSVENINNALDNLNDKFAPIITFIDNMMQVDRKGAQNLTLPYEQLRKTFNDFRISVRGTINRSIGESGSIQNPDGQMIGGFTTFRRKNNISLNIVSQHQPFKQKYLL
jgi:hypothetical protein